MLQRHVRGLQTLEPPALAMHDDENSDGLELLRGHEAEHELVVEGALVMQHRGELRTDAKADVVCAGRLCCSSSARGHYAHVQQLWQKRVDGAHDGDGLLLRGLAPGVCQLHMPEGRQQLQGR